MDIKSVLGFAFTRPWGNPLVLGLLAALLVIAVTQLMVSSAITPESVKTLAAFYSLFYALSQTARVDPSYVLMSYELVSKYLFYFIPLVAAFWFVRRYITALILLKALQVKGLTTPRFSPERFVKLIALNVAQFFAVALSLFKKRFTIVPVLVVLLFLARGTVIPDSIFYPAAAVLLFLYGIVILYNALRLYVSEAVFLGSQKGVMDSLKESWMLTQGRVFKIFLVAVSFAAVVLVVALLATVVGSVFGGIAFSATGSTTALRLVARASNELVGPFFAVIINFLIAAIYLELLGKKRW